MKTKMLVGLLGGLVLVSGCVSTVNDRHAFALSTKNDKFEGRYERSVDQVYAAAVEVMKNNGTISEENVLNPGPNQARAIQGKVNARDVYVRVQAVDPKVTSVTVQVRNKAGTDQQLTQELQKQIAVNLATR